MHIPILKVVLIVLVAAFCATLTMFYNFKAGRDSWDEGRLALAAQSLGWWICFSIVLWSVTVDNTNLRWALRGAAALSAIVGVILSVYLANPSEFSDTPDEKSDVTTTDSQL
jgi:hypothetical protein